MTSETKLVIFDMDDLMIYSHATHMEVFEEVLQKYGASLYDPENPLTIQEEANQFGRKIKDILAYFQNKYGIKTDTEVLHADFNELLLPVFGKHVVPMPGLTALIGSLKKTGFDLAIASSAIRPKIDIVLGELNLAKDFKAIVSGEEIKHGKPAPDIFLKAAKDVGIEPGKCVVLEDAKNGILAAKAAGMYAIGVHNKFDFEKLGIKQDLSMADFEVDSLEQISPEIIKNLHHLVTK